MSGLLALSPLPVFAVVYLLFSLWIGDFYKLPISVAFLFAAGYAVAISRGMSLSERINVFSKGAGDRNLMLMFWIYVLAGAFAEAAKQMGSIDETVHLTLNILPAKMLLPGLFLSSCFISLSIGTSVGTVVALVPIAVGIADTTGVSTPLMVGTIVGGAYFGDNLSFISDTTVAATQSQGCNMKDKFSVNLTIVGPAAIILLVVYYLLGSNIQPPPHLPTVQYIKVLPYIAIFIAALLGFNVMLVLSLGIALCGIVGFFTDTYGLTTWLGALGKGVSSMGELIIIAMLAGGMLELIKANGGISYLIKMVTSRVQGKRGGELSIAMLVSVVNVCTANNTVAIITVGGIAKEISDKLGIDPRKAASILDTFSCFVQGLLPYGVQMLLAGALAHLNPMQILPYLYYPMTMGVAALGSILFRYPKRFS